MISGDSKQLQSDMGVGLGSIMVHQSIIQENHEYEADAYAFKKNAAGWYRSPSICQSLCKRMQHFMNSKQHGAKKTIAQRLRQHLLKKPPLGKKLLITLVSHPSTEKTRTTGTSL